MYLCMYGLEAKSLVSASSIGLGLALVLLTWPQKCATQCKVILVVSISWLYHCNIHYHDVVKHSNVGHKFSYVLLALSPCLLIEKYLYVTSTSKTWPWPRPHGSDLGLRVLSSFDVTGFIHTDLCLQFPFQCFQQKVHGCTLFVEITSTRCHRRNLTNKNEKSAQRDANTALAVVRWSQTFLPHR